MGVSEIFTLQRIGDVIKSTHLYLLYELFLLSMKITVAMLVAAVRMVIPPKSKNLLGETVLITGAGHGIGRELAIQLSNLGCIIICWDTDNEACESTMTAVLHNGGEAYGFNVDVSDREAVSRTIDRMKEKRIPDVSILINNAAVLYYSSFLNGCLNNFKSTFSVNVLSHVWTIHGFIRTMMKRNKGHIVSINSMCGIYGLSEKVSYCASKFAARGLMDALREELRQDPRTACIQFTTIYPFYVDTGLAKDPKYRFPYIFQVVSPEYAAKEIIKAIRRNYTEYAIPRCLLTLNAILRIVPESVMTLILDFLSDAEKKWKKRNN
ncbi:firelighter [Colletes latitarsis]|uniref:firelighter n=1 Tax=Colletes latitarsis TaxID=2605962 RepID=UPI0040369F49